MPSIVYFDGGFLQTERKRTYMLLNSFVVTPVLSLAMLLPRISTISVSLYGRALPLSPCFSRALTDVPCQPTRLGAAFAFVRVGR